jgi:hypothetical protein
VGTRSQQRVEPAILTTDFKTDPYWWDAVPRPELGQPQLPARADVVVIGSGYTGLNAALQTSRGARHTVVLDSEAAGWGCSTRNGGQISTSIKPDYEPLARKYGAQPAFAILREGHETLRWISVTAWRRHWRRYSWVATGSGAYQLSGGQRQRVALARAIVFAPRILLMDEPLSALDKKLREHMQIQLRHLHEKLGMTTVYVTHDQREALTMSDRIAVIDHGRLMQLDAPKEIYERPANRFVADFIGESTFLPVSISAGEARFGNKVLELPSPPSEAGDHLLMLRPERLHILSGTVADPNMNTFEGTVKEMVYQGESFLMYVGLDEGSQIGVRGVTRRNSNTADLQVGGTVALGLHRDDTVLISAAD